MFKYFGTYIFLFVFVQVQGIFLKGPPLTRYHPCGLGVLYFEKVTDNLWKGTINLKLATTTNNIISHIKINFKYPLLLYKISPKSKVKVYKWRKFTLLPEGKLPPVYHMYFSINSKFTVNKPTVKKFSINNKLLCDRQKYKSEALNTDGNFQCGRRSPNHSELVTVRTDAKAGDWPWHVAIFIRDLQNNAPMYQCGGNIVSRTAVLTAGHCLFDGNKMVATNRLVVQAGISNLKSLNEIGRQILAVERVVLHPGYVSEQATFDLAILFVNKLKFTEYVQPICICRPLKKETILYGQNAVVAGFGMTEKKIIQSDSLRTAHTVIQRDEICIASAPKLYSSLLNRFTFCAGDNSGSSPLTGDSGGGLALPVTHVDNKISWYLRGILSKCVIPYRKMLCDPRYFMVYTDIALHYDWIKYHVNNASPYNIYRFII